MGFEKLIEALGGVGAEADLLADWVRATSALTPAENTLQRLTFAWRWRDALTAAPPSLRALRDAGLLRNMGDRTFHSLVAEHGTQMALAILVLGLLAARLIDKGLRKGLKRLMPTARFITIFCNIVYIAMVASVVTAALVEVGAHPVNMLRLLTIITLVAAGLFIFFRPFLPSLPFKVGNTVKVGGLLGCLPSSFEPKT